MLSGIGGDAPAIVGTADHFPYGVGKEGIQFLIPGIGIDQAGAAHHLAPVFPPPALVGIRGRAELVDKAMPQIRAQKLRPGNKVKCL